MIQPNTQAAKQHTCSASSQSSEGVQVRTTSLRPKTVEWLDGLVLQSSIMDYFKLLGEVETMVNSVQCYYWKKQNPRPVFDQLFITGSSRDGDTKLRTASEEAPRYSALKFRTMGVSYDRAVPFLERALTIIAPGCRLFKIRRDYKKRFAANLGLIQLPHPHIPGTVRFDVARIEYTTFWRIIKVLTTVNRSTVKRER